MALNVSITDPENIAVTLTDSSILASTTGPLGFIGPAGPQGPAGPPGSAADITGVESRLDALEGADVDHLAAADPHPQYLLAASYDPSDFEPAGAVADLAVVVASADDALDASLSSHSSDEGAHNIAAQLAAVASGIPASEDIRDLVAAFLVQGLRVTLTHDDVGNILTIDALREVYNVPFGFSSAPLANEVLLVKVFTDTVTFPDDWAGFAKYVETNPGSAFTLTIKKNTTTVGTVVIASTGEVTCTTSGGSISFAAGEAMVVTAQASVDSTIANVAINLRGARG